MPPSTSTPTTVRRTITACVAATRRQVIFYDGRPVKAFFSASNGGLTSGVEDIWQAPALPYFVSRTDTYDAQSPDLNWGPVTLDIDQLRSAFRDLPARIVNVTIARNAAGRASTVTFVECVDCTSRDVTR